jgi:Tfp pilus assembly protein PilV
MKEYSAVLAAYELGGTFVLFEKVDSQWLIKSIQNFREPVTDFKKHEVLHFNSDLSFVEPDFRDYKSDRNGREMTCWTGPLRGPKDNHTTDYNPCTSSLTSISSLDIGTNVGMAVITLGVSALVGTTTRSVAVDKDKVLQLILDTNALEKIRAKNVESATNAYHFGFSAATTSDQFAFFIKVYENNDPEDLVPQAKIKRDQLLEIEIKERAIKQADQLKARELAHAQSKARDDADKYKKIQDLKKISSFRNSIRQGDETNCGPVVEDKGKLVKIAIAIENYGNEHWVRRDEIFPLGYQCRFINGQYQPPQY